MTVEALAATGLSVVVVGPDGAQQQLYFDLSRPQIVIGRDETCDIALRDSEVSRRHVCIHWNPTQIVVEDTSSNGTVVGGQLVQRQSVRVMPGTPVIVARYQIYPELVQPRVMEATATAAAVPLQPSSTGSAAPARQPSSTGNTAAAPGGTALVSPELRRKLHSSLVDHLDLLKLERARMNRELLRAKVDLALQEICAKHAHLIPRGTDIDKLVRELSDEAVGLGPLESLLADDKVSEIMVVDPSTIYVERAGKIELCESRFTDNNSVRSTLERIVMPLGRRIDESSPMLDARLPDGSRVNAIIPPLATRGPCITIRKFAKVPLTMDDLLRYQSMTDRMAQFLQRSVIARKNVIIAGGTGSGKTTLLNVLSAYIPEGERVVTIEDSAELQLQQSHVVTLEARPPNMEGRGEVTIRDLVKNAMRMRPDRVVVGECRGGEALDMLMAMNTGHDGSMTTTHANNPTEALRRIETLATMAGLDLPARAIREQIAYAVDLVVHQHRYVDGSRRISSIAEVAGIDDDGVIEVREIFGFRKLGAGSGGKVHGEFYATGYLPSFLDEFLTMGIIREGEAYL